MLRTVSSTSSVLINYLLSESDLQDVRESMCRVHGGESPGSGKGKVNAIGRTVVML